MSSKPEVGRTSRSAAGLPAGWPARTPAADQEVRRTILLVSLVFCAVANAPTLTRKIDLPKDSPVSVVSSDWGDSNATVRGGAYFVDVHAGLTLRNSGQRRIRGITLAVLAQEVTPGGKGAGSQPSLDVAPGDTFSLRIDMPLLRPLGGGQAGPAAGGRPGGGLFHAPQFLWPAKRHPHSTLTVGEPVGRPRPGN